MLSLPHDLLHIVIAKGNIEVTQVTDDTTGNVVPGVTASHRVLHKVGFDMRVGTVHSAAVVPNTVPSLRVRNGNMSPRVRNLRTGITTIVPATTSSGTDVKTVVSGVKPDSRTTNVVVLTLVENVGPSSDSTSSANPERVGGGNRPFESVGSHHNVTTSRDVRSGNDNKTTIVVLGREMLLPHGATDQLLGQDARSITDVRHNGRVTMVPRTTSSEGSVGMGVNRGGDSTVVRNKLTVVVNLHVTFLMGESNVGPAEQSQMLARIRTIVPRTTGSRTNVETGRTGVKPDSGVTLVVGQTSVNETHPVTRDTVRLNPEHPGGGTTGLDVGSGDELTVLLGTVVSSEESVLLDFHMLETLLSEELANLSGVNDRSPVAEVRHEGLGGVVPRISEPHVSGVEHRLAHISGHNLVSVVVDTENTANGVRNAHVSPSVRLELRAMIKTRVPALSRR